MNIYISTCIYILDVLSAVWVYFSLLNLKLKWFENGDTNETDGVYDWSF